MVGEIVALLVVTTFILFLRFGTNDPCLFGKVLEFNFEFDWKHNSLIKLTIKWNKVVNEAGGPRIYFMG